MLALRRLRSSFPRHEQLYAVLPLTPPLCPLHRHFDHPVAYSTATYGHHSPQPLTHATAPSPKHRPPGPSPEPTADPGSSCWGDQSPVIPREPPKPIEPELAAAESVEVSVAPGVELSGHKKQIVAAVLDLLQGKVTREKMAFWTDDCVFEVQLSIAKGEREVEARWFALKRVMKDITMLRHDVVKVEARRVEMLIKNRYTLRGIGTVQVVESNAVLELDGEGPKQKIRRMEDRHNGTLPKGKIAELLRRSGSIATAMVTKVPSPS